MAYHQFKEPAPTTGGAKPAEEKVRLLFKIQDTLQSIVFCRILHVTGCVTCDR